ARHDELVPPQRRAAIVDGESLNVGHGRKPDSVRTRRNRAVQEDVIHAAPAEVTQQTGEATLHPADVHVVAKARLAVDAGNSRLADVDFPWVEIEDGRLALAAVDPLQHPAR